MINGKQSTIIWHIDYLKISHKKSVEDIIDKLNKRLGEYSPLGTSRGKKLKYLEMTLDYTTKGKVTLKMYEYINKMLRELP